MEGLTTELLAILAAVIVGLTAFDDAIAAIVSRVPVVGPTLAPILRRLSARFRDWLTKRVRSSAVAAVQEAEGRVGAGHGELKKDVAVDALKQAEPGLTETELEREIQRAFDRMMGSEALGAQAGRRAAPVPE